VPPRHEALANRRSRWEYRLLLHEDDAQPVGSTDLAGVERQLGRDRLEQRRLARAVAADQSDTLAGRDGQRGSIEQRLETVGEFRIDDGKERHEAREHRTGTGGRTGLDLEMSGGQHPDRV
jgi:hypothetical protein